MSSPPPDPDLVYRTWLCKVQNPAMSIRDVAASVGIPKSTAADYVQRGHEAEAWGYVLDRAADRGSMAAEMDMVRGWLFQERHGEYKLDEKLAIVDRICRIWDLKAKLHGLNMPARIEVSSEQANAARDALASDPTLAAVRALQKRNEYDEAELKAGRPGVITPRGEDTA